MPARHRAAAGYKTGLSRAGKKAGPHNRHVRFEWHHGPVTNQGQGRGANVRNLVLIVAVLATACGGRSVVFMPPPSNAIRAYVDVGDEDGWSGLAVNAFQEEAECRDANVYAVGRQEGAHYLVTLGDRETRFEAGVVMTLYDGRGDTVYTGNTYQVTSSIKDACTNIAAHLASGAELVSFD